MPTIGHSACVNLLILTFTVATINMKVVCLTFLPTSTARTTIRAMDCPVRILASVIGPSSVAISFSNAPTTLKIDGCPHVRLKTEHCAGSRRLVNGTADLLGNGAFGQ